MTYVRTQAQRDALSAAFKEKWKDPAWRERMRKSFAARPPVSEAVRAAMSASRRGRKQSRETVERRAASQRGQRRSPEVCLRISAALRGKKWNHKHRVSQAWRQADMPAEYVERFVRYNDDAHRRRMRSEYNLWRRYGVTLHELALMIDAQGTKCRCGRPLLTHNRKLIHIDHCHDTGRVRGVLCAGCNRRVGTVEKLFRDWGGVDSVLSYVLSKAG